MKKKNEKQKVIIDLEFNGLPRYNYDPEIVQVKLYNTSNGQSAIENFYHSRRYQSGALSKTGNLSGKHRFSAKALEKLLKKVDATFDDEFVGFAIETDRTILCHYGVFLNYVQDIQSDLLRSKFDKEIIFHGRCMESCYRIVLGKEISVSHGGIDELMAIVDLYNVVKTMRLKKYMKFFPFGDMAGMPLADYVVEYRRKADGYRYNNGDALADSLTHYIDLLNEDEWW